MAKVIALSGDVGWEITAEGVRTELAAANGQDVEFHVNSRGGFVFEGIEIYNVIREYKGHTEARIVGLAASMASYIVLAANKVTAYDNAVFMIHNALAFSIGNHNDMRKTADVLESLSNIIAQAYVKKTGKTIKAVKSLMDDETYLFGEEILAENFIDEILESPDNDDNDDKASAIIIARESINACMNKMRAAEAANADFDRAVAYMDGMSALIDTSKPKEKPAAISGGNTNTPAGAGNENQEVKHMSLKALLADPANASAKAEFDSALSTARTEGETAAKDQMKAVIASISPKLMSDAYGPDVKEAGIKAITGEGHISTFETLVIMADRDIEAKKAADALAESKKTPETPGAGGGGEVDAEAAAAAIKARKADVLAQGGF